MFYGFTSFERRRDSDTLGHLLKLPYFFQIPFLVQINLFSLCFP